MRCAGALILSFLAVAVISASESPTSLAQEHARKACEVVWANGAPHQIERCVERTMAALGADEGLRYNDMARMLIDNGRELETCQAELKELRSELTNTKVSRKR